MKYLIELFKKNVKFISVKAFQLALGFSTVSSIFEIALGKILDGKNCFIILGILVLAFLILFLGCFIGVYIYLVVRKDYVVFTTDQHSDYIHFDNLLDNDIVRDNSKHKNIVINVNRCFDTIVDNKLISDQTLHGQVFKNLYY